MASFRSDGKQLDGPDGLDRPDGGGIDVEIGRAASPALGQVIVSTLAGEGIQASLSGTLIMVPGRFQEKAREILDFLQSEIAKASR